MEEIDSRWQPIQGFKTHKFSVYSAYLDTRETNNPVIRVIGVTRATNPEKVLCRMYYNTKDLQLVDDLNFDVFHQDPFLDVPGVTMVLEENENNYYHACFVLCPINNKKLAISESLPLPTFVSILPKTPSGLNYTERLPVINPNNGHTRAYQQRTQSYHKNSKNDVGLCVKPIHSNYNNWLEIIAFIEMNKMLGISKFIVYNESMSENVSCVLEYYKESEHLVSIRTWDLLRKLQISTNMIKNRGVLASLNDCFYRHMNSYQYLFSIDLDEYIIPHMHETIPEMLQYLNSADIKYMDRHWRQKEVMRKRPNRPNQNITTTYSFLNSFFYLVYGKIYASM